MSTPETGWTDANEVIATTANEFNRQVLKRRARRLVYEKFQPRYKGDLDNWRGRSLTVAIDLVTPRETA